MGLCISFLFCAIKITLGKKWHTLALNNTSWILPALCFNGTLVFYALSFKYAPPEQADLIIYLWPAFVILLSRFFIPEEQIKLRHILSVLVGVSGIAFLILQGGDSSHLSLDPNHLLGYIFAFLCALCWSVYTILSRKNAKTPPAMTGIYCGLGAPIAWALHFSLETAVIPNPSQIACLLVYGIAVLGLAYTFWDVGIKRGNFKLLTILSYGNPVLSVLVLVAFGKVEFTTTLAIASVLIASSAIIGKTKSPKTRKTNSKHREPALRDIVVPKIKIYCPTPNSLQPLQSSSK